MNTEIFSPQEESKAASLINRIVSAALRQRFLTALLALLLIGGGMWSFSRLPVDAYPDLSPPQVEINAQWPGHAAEEVAFHFFVWTCGCANDV
jgi:heavy metal efflux system protein